MLVKLGYNVVLMGNHQGTEESEILASGSGINGDVGLKGLEKKIAAEKGSERAAQYPGSFQFVQSFTPEDKKHFFAAEDVDVKDSDNHTGANEETEEDGPANGALQAGPNYNGEGEGAITSQGIPVDFKQPGVGQTLIPEEDTEKSWLETVYIPLIHLWKTDRMGFRKNQALSPRLDRIQGYRIAASTYASLWEKGLEQQDKDKLVDEQEQAKIIKALDKHMIKDILNDGRGLGTFGFRIMGVNEDFHPTGIGKLGLAGFVEEKERLEKKYGFDAFLGGHFLNEEKHVLHSRFDNYHRELLGNTPAAGLWNDWVNLLENSNASTLQKMQRFGLFDVGLAKGMRKSADAAMTIPGGIKFEGIKVERQGSLMTDIISDKALEGILLNAQGLYGVIIGITPIPNLLEYIK
jgi:hypothetical protein